MRENKPVLTTACFNPPPSLTIPYLLPSHTLTLTRQHKFLIILLRLLLPFLVNNAVSKVSATVYMKNVCILPSNISLRHTNCRTLSTVPIISYSTSMSNLLSMSDKVISENVCTSSVAISENVCTVRTPVYCKNSSVP